MSCNSACVPEGPRGLSAYEIWLSEGNTGTEQDFLDSLVGADGPQGEPGPQGIPGPAGECNCECELIYYKSARSTSVSSESTTLLDSSFTVTNDGVYEYLMVGQAAFGNDDNEVNLVFRVNGIDYDSETQRRVYTNSTPATIPFTMFISQIPLVVGDVIAVTGTTPPTQSVVIERTTIKLTKIG